MTYSAECWAVKGNHEQKLHVAEMKMLRMMWGVTRWDRLRNEYVRGSVGVELWIVSETSWLKID